MENYAPLIMPRLERSSYLVLQGKCISQRQQCLTFLRLVYPQYTVRFPYFKKKISSSTWTCATHCLYMPKGLQFNFQNALSFLSITSIKHADVWCSDLLQRIQTFFASRVWSFCFLILHWYQDAVNKAHSWIQICTLRKSKVLQGIG